MGLDYLASSILKMARMGIWGKCHTDPTSFHDVQLCACISRCVREDNSLVSHSPAVLRVHKGMVMVSRLSLIGPLGQAHRAKTA